MVLTTLDCGKALISRLRGAKHYVTTCCSNATLPKPYPFQSTKGWRLKIYIKVHDIGLYLYVCMSICACHASCLPSERRIGMSRQAERGRNGKCGRHDPKLLKTQDPDTRRPIKPRTLNPKNPTGCRKRLL